ncbi:selenoprotein F [Tanacetum coccineum]
MKMVGISLMILFMDTTAVDVEGIACCTGNVYTCCYQSALPPAAMPLMAMSPMAMTSMAMSPMAMTPGAMTPMAMTPGAMTPMAMTPGAMTPVAMSPMPIPGPIVSEKKKVIFANSLDVIEMRPFCIPLQHPFLGLSVVIKEGNVVFFYLLVAIIVKESVQLLSDCRKCCAEDSDEYTSKIIYSGAVLEVCMRKLVFYPKVVNFIGDEKDKFPSVKVQYAFNAPPKLIMLDDAGQHKEHITGRAIRVKAVGVVTAIGPGVNDLNVANMVYHSGSVTGTYTRKQIVLADKAAPLPPIDPFEVASVMERINRSFLCQKLVQDRKGCKMSFRCTLERHPINVVLKGVGSTSGAILCCNNEDDENDIDDYEEIEREAGAIPEVATKRKMGRIGLTLGIPLFYYLN